MQAPRGAGPLRVYPALAAAAAAVVAVDQATKQLALDRLADGPHDVVPGILTMRLTYNSGGAFGLGRGLPWVLLIATTVVIATVLVVARHAEGPAVAAAFGLVAGGGLGNIADRVFRDLGGRVVDFIDLHVWPVFNVADVAIVTGAGALLIYSLRAERRKEAP